MPAGGLAARLSSPRHSGGAGPAGHCSAPAPRDQIPRSSHPFSLTGSPGRPFPSSVDSALSSPAISGVHLLLEHLPQGLPVHSRLRYREPVAFWGLVVRGVGLRGHAVPGHSNVWHVFGPAQPPPLVMVLLCLLSPPGTVAWYPPRYLAYGRRSIRVCGMETCCLDAVREPRICSRKSPVYTAEF